jgi:hypothetical protein
MTRDDIREILARELFVQDHAGKLRTELWSRRERVLHSRREWYVSVGEKTRNRWRTAADSLIKSLAKSDIELAPSPMRSDEEKITG